MSTEFAWWDALVHGGCLIAPARLEKHFEGQVEPLAEWRFDRLRRAQERFITRGDVGAWIQVVLEDALGHRISDWPQPEASEWTVKSVNGERLRPRRIFDQEANPLPLFVSSSDRVGIGKGRRDVARAIEWLRGKDLELALVTNGRQWRIVYAGETADAWAESSIDNWFYEGRVAPALEALRNLLSPSALRGPLRAGVVETRKGQSELSSALGERVRQAVEHLIVSCRTECDRALDAGEVTLPDLYSAGVRMIMRMVVLLFAESRELLPLTEAAYYRSYSLRSLLETLEKEGNGPGGSDRLSAAQAAWPRIISLCRLVHQGSPHPRLAVPKYGGELFVPGDPAGKGMSRAIAAMEHIASCPNDFDVRFILNLITKAEVVIRQGRGAAPVKFPVDFSQIDTEYIGILYEGLLDYELRRVDEGQPQIILNLGDQPILPLTRLQAMTPAQLRQLLEKMKVKRQTVAAGDEDSGDEDQETADAEELEEADDEEPADPVEMGSVEPAVTIAGRSSVRAEALEWAKKAAKAARMVGANASEAELDKAARSLIADVRAPGEFFLMRFGGTRKGSGTFYTVPALAAPTVRRTLEPLLRTENGPREPDSILSLKICDPACGSGSFPLAALRLVTAALYDSLIAHGWISEEDGAVRRNQTDSETPEWLVDALNDMPGLNEPAARSGGDERVRARLKRHVVERCLYGVDINPLAVELTRISLWIETMDPRLPFSFLDHKFKVGNAILGSWFDTFRCYPIGAWSREGGDKNYSSPRHEKGSWTKAITTVKKAASRELGGQLNLFAEIGNASAMQSTASSMYRTLHAAVTEPESQKRRYEEWQSTGDHQKLKQAFDTWCSLWFWPGKCAGTAPLPSELRGRPDEYSTIVKELTERHRFFHWELEFPDVFFGHTTGFDAVVGNPPWENVQPNPKEWFSNIDPLFRSYGRLHAKEWQRSAFNQEPEIETEWLEHNEESKCLANWVAKTGSHLVAFGHGFADANHPFRLQTGRIFTYRLFLEQGLALLRGDGRLGMIVPSAVYTDAWSKQIREKLLCQCSWEWLFGFENRHKIFKIDSRFKFCVLIVKKGGETDSINTAFMRLELTDWETSDPTSLALTRIQIDQFSPKSRAILETRTQRDLEILQTITANGVPLGDEGEAGWNVRYAIEFMMNTDAELFPPREDWEQRGYFPDEYGHWLKGNWEAVPAEARLQRAPGLVMSRSKDLAIKFDDIEGVALPLYEGRMIGQFDFSKKGWVSGKGRGAKWREIEWGHKAIEPQYLMSFTDHMAHATVPTGSKVSHMRIGSATNSRSSTATLLHTFAGGDTAAIFWTNSLDRDLCLAGILSSLTFDWAVRLRLGGLHLDYHVYEQTPLPSQIAGRESALALCVARLAIPGVEFSLVWEELGRRPALAENHLWRLWALTPCERARIKAIVEALVAHLYGLTEEQFGHLFLACDTPADKLSSKAYTRELDSKGFWRVDKGLDPELRQTVLAQVAFQDLKDLIRRRGEEEGLESFVGTGPDDGWMIPETLRLRDYGLGHDDRAEIAQPVASRLGPRSYDWQLAQSPEESWAECRIHAENIRAIRSIGLPGGSPAPAPEVIGGRPPKSLFDVDLQPPLL